MVEAPPIQLHGPPEPPVPECDRILGAYLRAWNQVEHGLSQLFTKLIDTNQDAAYIVFHGIPDAGARRRILEALANSRLNKAGQKKLFDLMERLANATQRRNRIIHGEWMMMIQIHRDKTGTERARTATWVRAYMPVDLELFHEMHKNPKTRKQYRYEIKTIVNITNEAQKFARELMQFAESISLLPYVPPRPLDISELPPKTS